VTEPSKPVVNRGLIVGLGAVVTLAALYFLVVMPLLLNDAEDVGTAAPTEVRRPSPVPEVSVSPEPGEATPPPETFAIFSARDPFQQLVIDAAAPEPPGDGNGGSPSAPSPGSTAPTGSSGTSGGTSPSPVASSSPGATPRPTATPSPGSTPQPSASVTPTPGAGGGGGANGAGSGTGDAGSAANGAYGSGDSTQVGATGVELIDVFESGGTPTVSVAVNGTGYTVAEGAEFGDRFRLLDISGTCATFLFGDSRFTLCEGQSIRK